MEEVERWFISSLEEIAGTRDGRALLRREAGRKGGVIELSSLRKEFERRCARPPPENLPLAAVRRALTQGNGNDTANTIGENVVVPTLQRGNSLPARLLRATAGGAGQKLLNELFGSEVQKVQRPKDGSRPNFFVCIKIDDPEIVKNVQGFQEFLVACDPGEPRGCERVLVLILL